MHLFHKHYKSIVILLGWIAIQAFTSNAVASNNFEGDKIKADFYSAFASSSTTKIDQALAQVNNNTTLSHAYKGALLMKKAGLLKHKKEQLETFKEGRALLEASISRDPQNVEFRFMRIAIQEKAPRILGYNKNIDEDTQLLKKEFQHLDKNVKSSILEYAKTSKALSHLNP